MHDGVWIWLCGFVELVWCECRHVGEQCVMCAVVLVARLGSEVVADDF